MTETRARKEGLSIMETCRLMEQSSSLNHLLFGTVTIPHSVSNNEGYQRIMRFKSALEKHFDKLLMVISFENRRIHAHYLLVTQEDVRSNLDIDQLDQERHRRADVNRTRSERNESEKTIRSLLRANRNLMTQRALVRKIKDACLLGRMYILEPVFTGSEAVGFYLAKNFIRGAAYRQTGRDDLRTKRLVLCHGLRGIKPRASEIALNSTNARRYRRALNLIAMFFGTPFDDMVRLQAEVVRNNQMADDVYTVAFRLADRLGASLDNNVGGFGDYSSLEPFPLIADLLLEARQTPLPENTGNSELTYYDSESDNTLPSGIQLSRGGRH
jgi:hypothetical protein